MLLNEIKSELDLPEKDDPWEDIGYRVPPKEEPILRPQVKKTRINLNVPFAQRESAKRAGARWDPGLRKWYMIVSNEDLKKIPNAWR